MRRIRALRSFILFNSDFNISASFLWMKSANFAQRELFLSASTISAISKTLPRGLSRFAFGSNSRPSGIRSFSLPPVLLSRSKVRVERPGCHRAQQSRSSDASSKSRHLLQERLGGVESGVRSDSRSLAKRSLISDTGLTGQNGSDGCTFSVTCSSIKCMLSFEGISDRSPTCSGVDGPVPDGSLARDDRVQPRAAREAYFGPYAA
jgi:hypothetical protein